MGNANTKTEKQDEEKRHAREALKSMGVKPGARVYTSISHVSSSGMSRHVQAYVVGSATDHITGKNGPRIFTISGLVATLCGYRRDPKSNALIVGGCGFDAGHDVTYNLGRAMFPKGGPVAKSVRVFQESKNGETREKDGGYLLRHDRLG